MPTQKLIFIYLCLILNLTCIAQNKGMGKPITSTKADDTPERRLALVIGNGDYSNEAKLKNPINDAKAMSEALVKLGFTVIMKTNVNRVDFEKVVDEFGAKLSKYDVGLFYYSGHGLQSQGENYLIPVDASSIDSEPLIKYKCIDFGRVMASMEGSSATTKIAILDACRSNPYKKGWSSSKGETEKVGFTIPNNPPGSCVIFATSAGRTADDNPLSRNGLFTESLLNYINTPNLSLASILTQTRKAVYERSNKNQLPEDHVKLLGDFYFVMSDKDKPLPTINPQELEKVLPKTLAKKFLDLPFAEMAYIQGGTFEMGDTRNEGFVSEKPVHTVKLDGFYMGKYEVTQRQWVEIMNGSPKWESIMNNHPSQFKDCADCPVEGVSWNDVEDFLEKLNLRTGSNYRLPTEAEWEYAAGGGSNNRTRFGNGMDILESSNANFDASAKHVTSYSRAGEHREKPIKVGSFRSNGLGLYDMTGNVWEWCSDWKGEYSSGISENPAGPATGTYRVLRGGSWFNFPQNSRVAYRYHYSPDHRFYNFGFRVVLSQ